MSNAKPIASTTKYFHQCDGKTLTGNKPPEQVSLSAEAQGASSSKGTLATTTEGISNVWKV